MPTDKSKAGQPWIGVVLASMNATPLHEELRLHLAAFLAKASEGKLKGAELEEYALRLVETAAGSAGAGSDASE